MNCDLDTAGTSSIEGQGKQFVKLYCVWRGELSSVSPALPKVVQRNGSSTRLSSSDCNLKRCSQGNQHVNTCTFPNSEEDRLHSEPGSKFVENFGESARF